MRNLEAMAARTVEAEAFEHCLKPGSRPNYYVGATGSLVVG